MSATCGYEFNTSNWGTDECTKQVGHGGDHYDSFSRHSCPNQERPSRRQYSPRQPQAFDPDDDFGSSFT
jgi:hypothetical protein